MAAKLTLAKSTGEESSLVTTLFQVDQICAPKGRFRENHAVFAAEIPQHLSSGPAAPPY